MSIVGRLALLFIVVPILELALLIQVGRWVGLGPTLLLVVGTGVGGAILARAEGLRTLYAFQAELARGRLPGQPLLDALSILVGGALLLTPGLLTDALGFVLLLPPTRRAIQRRIRRGLERRLREGTLEVRVWRAGPFGGGPFRGPFPGPEEPFEDVDPLVDPEDRLLP